jgi:hypothetical protein
MVTDSPPAAGTPAALDRTFEASPAGPDPTWRRLYRVGGISAFLYLVLGIVAPAVLFVIVPTGYARGMDVASLLTLIAENRAWWIVVQTLTLGGSFLAIPVFLAIFVALKDVDKSLAAVGSALAVICQVLFITFLPITLGMALLSDLYTAAAEDRRASLATTAEALIVLNDTFNPLYEIVFALTILILSVVMLRGVFPRWAAYVGLATPVAAVVAMILWPIVGIGYFWWWLIFVIWLVAVGWRLYRLGVDQDEARPAV